MMTSKDELEHILSKTLTEFSMPELGEKYSGKVRDMYKQSRGGNDELILITTDRLSAFDSILGAVPFKGQILNQLSLFWFEQVKDIVPNYVISAPHPHVIIGHECQALPVEVIVRGFISGVTKTSLWYQYSQGNRQIYGHNFPEGLEKNQALPEPIITPTTKGGPTGHDERLTCDEVVSHGYLEADLWQQVQNAAIAMFKKGQEVADQAGLILVDTKYEFGIFNDEIILIDEIHTPDSSRYFYQEGYQEKQDNNKPQKQLSKEFVREWLMENGFQGKEGQKMPFMPDQFVETVTKRYIELYEIITGKVFIKEDNTVILDRIYNNVHSYLESNS